MTDRAGGSGPRTNVHYRNRPRPHDIASMEKSTHRRRRSLRPAAPHGLTEGSVERDDREAGATLEIAGGPAGALAAVQVAGVGRRPIRLDNCGAARLGLLGALPGGRIDVLIDETVVLTGHVPAADREDDHS